MSTYNFTVSLKDVGKRVDKFLAEQLEGGERAISRSYIQQIVENPSRKVKVGEVVGVTIPEPTPLNLEPWDFPLDVVFENEDLLVINKPAGLTVHPAAGNWEKTLVHAVLHHCKGRLSGINGVERPGIVHRLDKDTSGLMVVAKSDEAHQFLATAIEQRSMKREYRAIVAGVPSPTAGIIESQIGRDKFDRKKMAVLADGGKHAVTEYRVVEVFGNGLASVIECKLQTGRTHQIRVHMTHIGCPIIGDEVYGSRRKGKNLPDFNRQALHAFRLSIPEVGVFEAELPEDMAGLMDGLRVF